MLCLRVGMHIVVRICRGQTVQVDLQSLKQKIQEKTGIPPSHRVIIYGVAQLRDAHTLAAYKIRV